MSSAAVILNLTQRAQQIIDRCREIATYTEIPGETTRTFLSEPMRGVHALLRGWMEATGMEVRVDAVGNLRGLRRGGKSGDGRVVIGSHLDTVPRAGAFDGILGVVLGVAIVDAFAKEELPMEIEVIGFSEEEGVRFRRPFLGSLAAIGELDEDALALVDGNGVNVAEAIRVFGLDSSKLVNALLRENTTAYLEVHIEQGPVLESVGEAIAVVESLVGQTRLLLHFDGSANHAGTTPMRLRRDAMAAAAEWIVAVEKYARATAGMMATVGRVETRPGAANVIAGEVSSTLDVRHAEDGVRATAVKQMVRSAENAGRRRGVGLRYATTMEQAAVRLDGALGDRLMRAAAKAGHHARRMTSGAGHDAMILARRVASTMLFVRSPGGVSHHPDETVLVEDVAAALATVLAFVRELSDFRDGRITDHA